MSSFATHAIESTDTQFSAQNARLQSELGEAKSAAIHWEYVAHRELLAIREDWDSHFKAWRKKLWTEQDFMRQRSTDFNRLSSFISTMPNNFNMRWIAATQNEANFRDSPIPADIDDGTQAASLFRTYANELDLLNQFIKETEH